MNVILIGFMGTGKTAVGKRLAKRLGWKFVDVDKLIEASAGMPIARIFTERSEPVFRRLERRHILRAVQGRHQVIATGGGAVVDPQNRTRMRSTGCVVCLTAKPKSILSRVGRQAGARPLLAGSRNPLARIQQLLRQRAEAYGQADITVDTTNLTIEQVVGRVWQALSPCLCKSWEYLLEHTKDLSHRYGGKYVVIANSRIVASGATQLEAYHGMPARLTQQRDVGIYYIPRPEDALTAFTCYDSQARRRSP